MNPAEYFMTPVWNCDFSRVTPRPLHKTASPEILIPLRRSALRSSLSRKRERLTASGLLLSPKSQTTFRGPHYFLAHRSPSRAVIDEWHGLHRLIRLLSALVPPLDKGIIWCTSSAGVSLPYFWHFSQSGYSDIYLSLMRFHLRS